MDGYSCVPGMAGYSLITGMDGYSCVPGIAGTDWGKNRDYIYILGQLSFSVLFLLFLQGVGVRKMLKNCNIEDKTFLFN